MSSVKVYVADTHALVWFFMVDSRLGAAARDIIRKASTTCRIIVPVIVLAEILHLSRRCRIPLSFQDTVNNLESHDGFEIVPLTDSIIKIAADLPDSLEMHDALIVATSIFYSATLITKDEVIIKNGCVKTLW
jgi:PIN domain nuclease of toxin-antitoxin system